jgi:hypothetical protein
MMRTTAASGLVLLLTLGAAVFAAPAQRPSFLGEWTATASTMGGDVSETVTAATREKGYSITVKPAVPAPQGTPEAGPGTDIVLDGDRFSYKRSIITPDVTIVITYEGVVSGDKFTGTAELGGFKVPYTGVRIKR